MPIPKPRPNEEKDKFVARCIRQLSKENPNRDRKQIIAICFQTWKDRKKESINKMDEKQYKKDEDGHYIIAENVPIIFNSTIQPIIDIEKAEEEDTNADKKD